MNNMNVLSYININKKHEQGSDEFVKEILRKVKVEILEKGRDFSEIEFEKALEKMQSLRFSLAGIDFILYQN
jgi:hypothetical protein